MTPTEYFNLVKQFGGWMQDGLILFPDDYALERFQRAFRRWN